MPKTYTFKDGSTFNIHQEIDPENPRWNDNLGVMVCLHKRFISLGDNHDYQSNQCTGWADLRQQIEKDYEVVAILPLYLYDHSGSSISTTPFSCPWDSGQVGWIFASRENLKRMGHSDNVDPEKVKGWLQDEVKIYNQYLQGDVYGFIHASPTTKKCETCGHVSKGETLDSCWGFYGDDPLTNGMIDHLPEKYQKELKTLAS